MINVLPHQPAFVHILLPLEFVQICLFWIWCLTSWDRSSKSIRKLSNTQCVPDWTIPPVIRFIASRYHDRVKTGIREKFSRSQARTGQGSPLWLCERSHHMSLGTFRISVKSVLHSIPAFLESGLRHNSCRLSVSGRFYVSSLGPSGDLCCMAVPISLPLFSVIPQVWNKNLTFASWHKKAQLLSDSLRDVYDDFSKELKDWNDFWLVLPTIWVICASGSTGIWPCCCWWWETSSSSLWASPSSRTSTRRPGLSSMWSRTPSSSWTWSSTSARELSRRTTQRSSWTRSRSRSSTWRPGLWWISSPPYLWTTSSSS